MGSSKIIFFLQCTSLAHFSSYVIEPYNFTTCNHTDIISGYQSILQKNIQHILKEEKNAKKPGDIINCCPELRPRDAVLACIHSFTKSCVAKQHSDLWMETVALLEENCYFKNNGSWNVEVRFRNSLKCKRQRREKCGTHTSRELNMMWNSYLQN